MADCTPDGLFEQYFWPHYPADVRADPNRFRDLDANPARNPELVAHLVEAAELFVRNAPGLLGVAIAFDAAGIANLARALDRPKRDAIIAASDPRDPGSPLLNTVVHAAAFVGETAVRAHGGAWSMRRPMWESVVMRPLPGGGARGAVGAIPPFHWLLKHLGDNEIDRASLAYRFHVHVELATADVAEYPLIIAPQQLPSMKSPSYDTLVKYLQRHIPAMRDLGEGFPTPAQFSERGYAVVGVELFHGGRVLALHGQVPPRGEQSSAVEVFWLTAAGFDHADTVPCDPNAPYFARRTGEALEVTVSWQSRPRTHRIGFRGHG